MLTKLCELVTHVVAKHYRWTLFYSKICPLLANLDHSLEWILLRN